MLIFYLNWDPLERKEIFGHHLKVALGCVSPKLLQMCCKAHLRRWVWIWQWRSAAPANDISKRALPSHTSNVYLPRKSFRWVATLPHVALVSAECSVFGWHMPTKGARSSDTVLGVPHIFILPRERMSEEGLHFILQWDQILQGPFATKPIEMTDQYSQFLMDTLCTMKSQTF